MARGRRYRAAGRRHQVASERLRVLLASKVVVEVGASADPDHIGETAVCDFFVVPTVTLQRLFAYVVVSLDRRRILHAT